MTESQRDLADYCEYLPEGGRRACYALASFVIARPSGEALRYSCAEHLPAWATRIQGRYLVLERGEWEARGSGYRGTHLGGFAAAIGGCHGYALLRLP